MCKVQIQQVQSLQFYTHRHTVQKPIPLQPPNSWNPRSLASFYWSKLSTHGFWFYELQHIIISGYNCARDPATFRSFSSLMQHRWTTKYGEVDTQIVTICQQCLILSADQSKCYLYKTILFWFWSKSLDHHPVFPGKNWIEVSQNDPQIRPLVLFFFKSKPSNHPAIGDPTWL